MVSPKRIDSLELQEMANSVMSLVGEVAGRKFLQALEFVYDARIAPLEKQIVALEKESERLKEALIDINDMVPKAIPNYSHEVWLKCQAALNAKSTEARKELREG